MTTDSQEEVHMSSSGTTEGRRTLEQWLKDSGLDKIKIGPRWLSLDLMLQDSDREAAWELYIEMLTRIVTQPLPDDAGDEQTALDSIYSLFGTTRGILRQRGRRTIEFSKVAIPVLNQVVRPFTAKWHKESLADAFNDPRKRTQFRKELTELQTDLRNYNRLLANIADVEDLTDLER